MTNKNDYAFPTDYTHKKNETGGLTKREYIATKMMAALIINRPYPIQAERVATDAIDMADALINQLNRTGTNDWFMKRDVKALIFPTDVRLDNWVLLGGHMLKRLSIHDLAFMSAEGGFNIVAYGVPITPEILNSKVNDMWYDKFSNSWTKGILSIAPHGDGFYSDPDHYEGVSYKPIQYVHQLQNLYHALTGEELNIKLWTNQCSFNAARK